MHRSRIESRIQPESKFEFGDDFGQGRGGGERETERISGCVSARLESPTRFQLSHVPYTSAHTSATTSGTTRFRSLRDCVGATGSRAEHVTDRLRSIKLTDTRRALRLASSDASMPGQCSFHSIIVDRPSVPVTRSRTRSPLARETRYTSHVAQERRSRMKDGRATHRRLKSLRFSLATDVKRVRRVTDTSINASI